MAKRRYATTGALVLIVGVGATFGIHRVLEAPKAQSRIVTRQVVVALEDIPDGRAIEHASVTVALWPRVTVPAGAYEIVDSVTGRITRTRIFRGEVIVRGRLLAP